MTILRIILTILTLNLAVLSFADNAKSQEQLMQKCEEARSLSQYNNLEKYSSQLLTEAKKHNNTRTQTYAYFYNGLAKLFNGQCDESKKMLDASYSMATNIGHDSLKALVTNAYGIYQALVKNNNFVAQQYFFKGLELAKKAEYESLQYRIRGNLLTLSQSKGDSLALENAIAVHDYGTKSKSYEQTALGAYYLAMYYYMHNSYPEAEKYISEALTIYKKYPYEDISSVYVLYAKVFLKKGNQSKAEEYVKEGIALAKQFSQASMEVDAYVAYAEILQNKGDYVASNEMVERAISKAETVEITSKSADCYRIMAHNYQKLGNDAKASEYFEKANTLLTEQAELNMERLSHEQQVMQQMEQSEIDAAINQQKIKAQTTFLIMLTIVIVVLVALLVFIIRSYRHRNQLYKSIVMQNTKAIARQEKMQKHIEHLTNELQKANETIAQIQPAKEQDTSSAPTPPSPSSSLDEDKIEMFYDKLCDLMDNERLYAEAQLTRERMAERLGTNRTYLTKIIKEKTGMSYVEFVNSYRINEAIRILSDKDKIDYPLKQIWNDLGFSSPSTFFKLFQQAVGITPSMYRKQFIEVN